MCKDESQELMQLIFKHLEELLDSSNQHQNLFKIANTPLVMEFLVLFIELKVYIYKARLVQVD